MSLCISLVTILLLVLSCVYLYFKYKFSHWLRRGIKWIPGSIPFGNLAPAFTLKKHMGEVAADLYRHTTEPFIGIFVCVRPALLVCDRELINRILVKDFNSFNGRGFFIDEIAEPMSAQMLSLSGDKWKNLRQKLTPTFTPGKLKEMFPSIVGCGDSLQRLLNDCASKKASIEIRDIAARYTTDVIASIAFGVEVNSIDNPNAEFREVGRRIFDLNIRNAFRWLAVAMFPSLIPIFRMRVMDKEVGDFMLALVKETIAYRQKNNVVRKDFLQLLIQLHNSGAIKRDDESDTTACADANNKQLTLTEIAANVLAFYVAGFETSSATTSYCLFELARNPEIQRKVHDEIDEVLAKHNGQITYEAIAEMTYMENCFDETLRKYPVVPLLHRESNADYRIPGTDIVLDKGTFVLIPVMGLHRNEEYFPDPLKFIPERFNDKNSIQPMTYLPFSEGPRICFGLRLAKIESKVALVLMMQHYRYELADTKYYTEELPISAANFTLAPTCGINLTIHRR